MKIKLNKFFIILCFFILLSKVNINAQDKKNILYISSGASTYSSTYEQMKGFNDSIRSEYVTYFEHMNSLKYPDKEHEDAFYSLLSYKLKVYPKFDAVVLSDDVAVSFGLKHQDLFNETPLFLTSVYSNDIITPAKTQDITCLIAEGMPLKQNIDLIGNIYKNYKDNKNIILLTGPDDIYGKQINEFYSLESKYTNLNFKNITLLFKDNNEIKNTLKNIDKEKDVLLFWMPTSSVNSKQASPDSTNFTSLSQILLSISNATDAPIFTNAYSGVDFDMIGGYAIDLYKQGTLTGDIVKQFLGGNKSIPKFIDGDDSNTLIFNYEQLNKYNINKDRLPKDAKIVYENEPLFIKYNSIIKYLSLAFIIFIIISILIIINYIMVVKANKKLKEAKKLAEIANESKNSFIANISHELRTPVTVISSSAQLIKKNLNYNDYINLESLSSNIKMIEQNSSRLTRLINNIIDVTKSDSGFKSLILQNVEVVSFIESTVLSVVPFAKTRDLNIIFDTDVEELIMAIDIDKIDRIILNLLSNAIKFSPNGSTILTTLSHNDNNLIISVEDKGIGISPENISNIFDKFSQIDNGFTRLNEGSGIGLSLVKSFVNLHSGDITVDSKSGEGTTFKVVLPINIIENSKVIYNIPSSSSNTLAELSDIYS